MSACYTKTKSFTGVMLRETDADQAHFNPQATTPYAFLHHTLVAYGINFNHFR